MLGPRVLHRAHPLEPAYPYAAWPSEVVGLITRRITKWQVAPTPTHNHTQPRLRPTSEHQHGRWPWPWPGPLAAARRSRSTQPLDAAARRSRSILPVAPARAMPRACSLRAVHSTAGMCRKSHVGTAVDSWQVHLMAMATATQQTHTNMSHNFNPTHFSSFVQMT